MKLCAGGHFRRNIHDLELIVKLVAQTNDFLNLAIFLKEYLYSVYESFRNYDDTCI